MSNVVTTGPWEDLIQVTLVFGTVESRVQHTAGIASTDMVGDHKTGLGLDFSTSSDGSLDGGPVSSDGKPVPTRMLVQSRGRFALCLDASCTSDGAVVMGFSGFGSNSFMLRFVYECACVRI